MRVADLSTGSARLRDSLDSLVLRWSETREYWTDENARRLEEERLRPMGDAVAATLAAAQHLAEVIGQAQRECESW